MLRVLNVAPLSYAIPPKGYGGIQRVACWLTKGLETLGDHVVLAGPKGSKNIPPFLEVDSKPMASAKRRHFISYFKNIRKQVEHEDIDLILGHGAWVEYLLPIFPDIPVFRTVHGFNEKLPAVKSTNFISRSQRETYNMPNAPFIYNPIDEDEFELPGRQGDYVVFMAKLDWPVKGLDVALRVTQKANLHLKLAGPGKKFFKKIRKLKNVEYVGEVYGNAKKHLLANALALLYPTQWPEPFGLAPVEANACGTPAVVTNNGAMPEVVAHGTSGFVCRSEDELIEGLLNAHSLAPRDCREWALDNFGHTRIAKKYHDYFESVLNNG